MNVVLAPGVLEATLKHARESLPNEGCGLIVGKGCVADRLIPMENVLASATSFEMEPAVMVSLFRAMRESGEDLVAIYHSHPSGPEYPSSQDIQKARYPNAAQLIVSFEQPESPVVRGFRIIDGEALEIELHAIV